MQFENLLVNIVDRTATVTVNRPAVMNALNRKTVEELDACFQELGSNPEAGVIIITGSGDKSFIAGADIHEFSAYSPPEAKESARRGQQMLSRLEALRKPTIAAVNGYALGGGCELAMSCTLRVASQKARFGQPEVKLGIIPGYGGTQRLPRLIGKGRALQMILTGEPISAEMACQWGLVNLVVAPEQLLDSARELARKILANGSVAIQYCLEAVHQGLNQPLDQGLCLESTLMGLCYATEDMREGTRAFLEKRRPNFVGK